MAGKSGWRKLLRAAIVGEVALLIGSYRVWHQMNTSRDYRKWMDDNYPAILEGFYRSAELGGYRGAREADAEAWGK
ncbi:protein CEBPZOS [Pocillopora verrucosa]|uniref:protein CEBPZOS n=1 Tax=Pocillopora verrucosa TaxID=203993 RepID=UPI00279720BD|nr:protein CEBPZOS-like [Pocillopora verrucosa]